MPVGPITVLFCAADEGMEYAGPGMLLLPGDPTVLDVEGMYGTPDVNVRVQRVVETGIDVVPDAE